MKEKLGFYQCLVCNDHFQSMNFPFKCENCNNDNIDFIKEITKKEFLNHFNRNKSLLEKIVGV